MDIIEYSAAKIFLCIYKWKTLGGGGVWAESLKSTKFGDKKLIPSWKEIKSRENINK